MDVDSRFKIHIWQLVTMSLEHLFGVVYFFKTLYSISAFG